MASTETDRDMRGKQRTRHRHSFWIRAAILGFSAALAPTPAASARPDIPIANFEVNDLSPALAEAEAGEMGTANQRILLVFDIDNTLLTMPQFLGSDQWFNYHAGLISGGRDPNFSTWDDLLAAQTALFSLASMKSTQEGTGVLIKQATSRGVDVFLLSARGPELYDATTRELRRNQIVLNAPRACSFAICNLSGIYRDADIRRAITALGGTPTRTPYRDVVIRDGVMLASAQDKGTMLRVLLAAIPSGSYDKIIFVDDSQKNIDSVATSGLPIPLSLYHYNRVQTAITKKEIENGERQWRKFRSTVCAIVSAPFCQLKP